jgi:uroporphyrinogen-III synthase
MIRRVLVTRPEPGDVRTARRLAEMGLKPIALPLSETVTLPVDVVGLPGNMTAVAVTSANAVNHAAPALIAALAGLPCHAVGRRTAQAARTSGFLTVAEGPGSAEALAETLTPSLPERTIAYLCGRVRLPSFEARLAAAGIPVFPIETYDTLAIDYSSETVRARLADLPVDAVLLYSAKAAEAAAALIRRPELQELFREARFLCLSARIAAALAGIAPDRLQVSPEPDEESLLSLLSHVD